MKVLLVLVEGADEVVVAGGHLEGLGAQFLLGRVEPRLKLGGREIR